MKKLRPIMFVGTCSDAGKSIVNTAFCRIFKEDGYNPAPFKSQNMSLNSYSTPEGKEIGRAQAVQAEACGINPHTDMNPILLKPTHDTGSQIVLNGEAIGNLSAREYFLAGNKQELLKESLAAFERLSQRYNPIVLEGAGSISEINLRDKDITNMRIAKSVNAVTYLVADIDRGGVFGSVYGSIMLLPEDERKLIKGIIINKFRGDEDLLKPAIDILDSKFKEEGLDIKFLGVIPYENLKIEEEDSLSDSDIDNNKDFGLDKYVNISIIKSKKMSNFTDFHIFKQFEDVRVQYVTEKSQLGNEDIIIIPGSKNTITDLIDLKQKGIFKKIKEQEKKGTVIVGICGGLQMLGEKIYDPEKLESEIIEIEGFGLLDYETIFGKLKRTKQVEEFLETKAGILKPLNGMKIKGYEIHQGKSTVDKAVICRENIFATYIHGIFDNSDFTNAFLNIIRERKNLERVEVTEDLYSFKDKEYNKLEGLLRKSLNIKEIYNILF